MKLLNSRARVVCASSIGNSLEYYDFCLYGALLPLISQYFFPSNPNSINWGLLIYTLTFMMRPLGAVFFGYIGDNVGRKSALTLSLSLMSIFTILLIVIPPYSHIGILSPILLVISRLGQGFCMGGEYGGSLVFSMEHFDSHKSLGFVGGIIGASTLFGCFIANLAAYIITACDYSSTFWKIPFVIGSCVGLVGYWIRKKTEESPQFNKFKKDVYLVNENSSIQLSYDYINIVIVSILLTGLTGFGGSLANLYLNVYIVKELNWNIHDSSFVVSAGILVSIVISLLTSKIIMILGSKSILRLCLLGYLILSLPSFFLISTGRVTEVYLAIIVFSVLNGIAWGTVNEYVYKLFIPHKKYTNIALTDSVGRIVFSGSTPYLCNFFSEIFDSNKAPAFYIIIVTIIIWGLFEIFSGKIKQ